MSNPEDNRIASAIAAAEKEVITEITNYVTNCIPDCGEVLCRCPLFKAGKPISKYATVRDEDHPDVETSWKEVVVTSNFSIKLQITMKAPEEKIQADGSKKMKPGKTKILTEWVSPLTSVISVVPHNPASESDKERGAEFCVLFLGNKDTKKADKEGAVNYRDDALRYLAPRHAELAKSDAANRPESIQKEMNEAEQEHLNHLTQDLAFPSCRCRAYVVPEALGGAETRDRWVDTYREAVFSSWKHRLSGVFPLPSESTLNPNLVITCVRFAEVTLPQPKDQQQQTEEMRSKKELSAVVAFEDKSCLILPVVAGGALVCTARCLSDPVKKIGLFVPTPYSVDKCDPIRPFKITISRGTDTTASLEFFTNAHADAFVRCTEQNEEGMVMSFSI